MRYKDDFKYPKRTLQIFYKTAKHKIFKLFYKFPFLILDKFLNVFLYVVPLYMSYLLC